MCDDSCIFQITLRQIQTVRHGALKLPAEKMTLNCMTFLHVKEGKVLGGWQHRRGLAQFIVLILLTLMYFFSDVLHVL